MHSTIFCQSHRAYVTVLAVFLFFLTACDPLPEADFYELKGIVSAPVHLMTLPQGWQSVKTSTSLSWIPLENTQPREIDIEFSANSGVYTFWLLSQARNSGSDNLLFRVENSTGDLIAGGRASVPAGLSREWMSREYTTGDLLTIHLPDRGVYRLFLSVDEGDQIIVDKIHLTRNNEHPPFGFGYASTEVPAGDPACGRTDRKYCLPSGHLFGTMEFESEFSRSDVQNGGRRCTEFTDLTDLYNTGYLEHPLKKLTPADLSTDPEDLTTYEWFEIVVEAVANMRLDLYEVPYLVADLEDFEFTEEEWIRWVQFSAWNSLMYIPAEAAPELSEEGREIVEFYTKLRQELFPYIYSTARDARMAGLKPLIGSDMHTHQFMLGEAFLVAPVPEPGSLRQIQLPRGKWYDYWNGSAYGGGRLVEGPADFSRVPIFVKAGSIIPYNKRGKKPNHLEIEIYGGGTGAGTFGYYEDDEISENYLDGEYSTMAFRYFEHDTHGVLTIGKRVRGYPGQPDRYQMTLRFKHIPEPVTIKANGETLEDSVWTYNNDSEELVLEWEQMADQKTDLEVVWAGESN